MSELALDIGQTQTRVRLIPANGQTAEVELDGFRYGSDVIQTILDRCVEGARHFNAPAIRAVACGVTGLYGLVPDLRELLTRLSTELGVLRAAVADDAVTSHLGALQGEQGALVAAGTGIVGLGIGPAGAARVDGVGSHIGDDGSGWWIGRRGIIAALSARDGRSGGSVMLLDALERTYGPSEQVPALIAGSPFPVSLVASFAPEVARVARDGDSEAAIIWTEAARCIGDAVVAAAAGAGFGRDARFPWAVTGRLALAADLLDPVMESIVHSRFRAAHRVTPAGTSLDGANTLLHLPNINSLAPLAGLSTKEKDIDD